MNASRIHFPSGLIELIVAFSFLALASPMRAATCTPAPPGLVGWWPGEGNGNDTAQANNGALEGGVAFAAGEVGQAFTFNGTSGAVHVPIPGLGISSGFSLEMWINPADVSKPRPLVQWSDPNQPYFGVTFWISVPPTNGGTGPGCLLVDVCDHTHHHPAVTAAGIIVSNAWQHVAATYDTASGLATLYLNGISILQTNFGVVLVSTPGDLWFGREYDIFLNDLFASIGNRSAWYSGLMDEIGVYNRALPASEIQDIYNAASAGRCPVPPTKVTIQPPAQTVAESESATFTAIASGTPPLTYQWFFNGTSVPGATNSSLVMSSVQLTNAGTYAVTVTNSFGDSAAPNATLSVLPSYEPVWVKTTAPDLHWMGVASSADGSKLAAVSEEGQVYTSSDYGNTWQSNNLPNPVWSGVVCSADGNMIAVAGQCGSGRPSGAIYTSTNAGTTWTKSMDGCWISIAASADCSRLVTRAALGGYVYASTNFGVTWTRVVTNASIFRLASSADGAKLLSLSATTGTSAYTSTNAGKTWTTRSVPDNEWTALCSSADGSRLAIASHYDEVAQTVGGSIYVSPNSGGSWYKTAFDQTWGALASSADGLKLVAAVYGGYIYVSVNGGTSWKVTRGPSDNWSKVASSADGTRLVAAISGGGIYTWYPTALNINLSGADLAISWPTNVPGFILQSSDQLPPIWQTVTNIPSLVGQQYQVILAPSGSNQVFRLMYP